MTFFLWGVVPYLVALTLIAGLIWRHHYDQFGWTTRSSQLYESKVLRVASPLFHFGLLFVLLGHLGGLLIPKSFTDRIGISQQMYHSVAVVAGTLAGFAALIGIALLIYRRRTKGRVFLATTRTDKLMYVVLVAVLCFGLIATLSGGRYADGTEHNYRETVSVWFRSLLVLQPNVAAMDASTWQFKSHILIGLALLALIPFCRLVHAFAAPIHYLFRPYIVYRSRDQLAPAASRSRIRGWDPIGTQDRDHVTK